MIAHQRGAGKEVSVGGLVCTTINPAIRGVCQDPAGSLDWALHSANIASLLVRPMTLFDLRQGLPPVSR